MVGRLAPRLDEPHALGTRIVLRRTTRCALARLGRKLGRATALERVRPSALSRSGRLYLLPAMVWFTFFGVFPLIYMVNISLRDATDPEQRFVGLQHYAEMLSDTALLASLSAT